MLMFSYVIVCLLPGVTLRDSHFEVLGVCASWKSLRSWKNTCGFVSVQGDIVSIVMPGIVDMHSTIEKRK